MTEDGGRDSDEETRQSRETKKKQREIGGRGVYTGNNIGQDRQSQDSEERLG